MFRQNIPEVLQKVFFKLFRKLLEKAWIFIFNYILSVFFLKAFQQCQTVNLNFRNLLHTGLYSCQDLVL